jgi:hypothetical protein
VQYQAEGASRASTTFGQSLLNDLLRKKRVQKEAIKMTTLPTPDRHVSIHLSDRALTPLISSSRPHPTTYSTPQSQSQSQSQSQALSSITTTAITAYDSASRLGLGLPQRVMIETRNAGPVMLHSYLNPQSSQLPRSRPTRNQENGRGIIEQAREDLRPLSGTSDGSSTKQRNDNEVLVNGVDYGKDLDTADGAIVEENVVQQPPLLIASVIAASTAEAGEARRAAARLERMGREFQREWAREQEEQLEAATTSEDG